MPSRHLCAAGLVLVVTAAALGCAGSAAPDTADSPDSAAGAVTLVNAVCPIMGGAATTEVTADWNGQTVGFCCAACIPDWEALPEKDKAAKLASADAAPAADAQMQHDQMQHDAESRAGEQSL